MSTPSDFPVPDPNATDLADENEENPAEEGQDTHYTEQQPDQADVAVTTQSPEPVDQGQPIDTDKGISG